MNKMTGKRRNSGSASPRLTLVFMLMMSALLLMPRPSAAQEAGAIAPRTVEIEANTAEAIRLGENATEIFVSNPEIADVQAHSSRTLYVFGKKPGETTVFASNAQGRMLATLRVRVTHALSQLRGAIGQLGHAETVRVTSIPGALVLSGTVGTPGIAADIQRTAETFLVDPQRERVINHLGVTAPTQVSLRVRVAEVSRTVNQQLGINWNTAFGFGAFSLGLVQGRNILDVTGDITGVAGGLLSAPTIQNATPSSIGGTYSGGRINANTVIDALANEGLITILAEPNLTALSGETASFLAGGEFPIPVAQQNNSLTIEFKQFGVSLAFTPTVLDDGRISLKVRPEVSEINNDLGIKLASTTVPGISTRRAETTVELGSGQSFAIGGLLQNNTASGLDKTPGLGDLPVLGPLFRSSRFQRNESELVIMVTPVLVKPVSGHGLALPTDGLEATSQMDRFLNQRLNRTHATPGIPMAAGGDTRRLVGPSGFIVE